MSGRGRRWAAAWLAATVAVGAGAMAAPGAQAAGAPAAGTVPERHPAVAGELIVGYEAGATPTERTSARARVGGRVEDRLVRAAAGAGRGEVELVRLPAGADRSAAARRLRAEAAVAYAEPNFVVDHAATASDPSYTNGSLWGLYGDATSPANAYGSQAGEAWAAGATGSASVYVGVIDEGIQFDHPDLAGQVWENPFDPVNGADDDGNGYVDDVHGWDFDGNDNSVYDGGPKGTLDSHGTHVAGTIAARADGSGVVGVNWDVTLISAKFLGRRGGTVANAVKAVDYFTDLKARHGLNVVATNNSWGGGAYSQAMFEAIGRADAAGILFVAAAGNGGGDGVGDNNDVVAHYPSSYQVDNVVSVAAIDRLGQLAPFSNIGPTSVDLGAPGVGVLSTTPYNRYATYDGTSMATPHVTGAAALYAAAHPEAGAAHIRSIVLSTATPTASLSGRTVTGGRLDMSSFGGADPEPVDPTAPSAPVNLSAWGGDGRIDMAWSTPLTDGGSPITGYRVYRDGAALATTAATARGYTDSPVANGTMHTYRVTALNAAGEGALSNPAYATAGQAPARSVTVTAGPKQKNLTPVTVTWSGFTGSQVDVFRVDGTAFSTANDGSLTESWRGSGTVSYRICETGSTTACATDSTVI